MTPDKECDIADQLSKFLTDLVTLPNTPEVPAGFASVGSVQTLYANLVLLRDIMHAFSKGDLSKQISLKGYIGGTLKTLQANLKHLTWQTNMIASGDFTQRVDFMGEFSHSFNTMVMQLDRTLKELVRKETELLKYREKYHTLQQENAFKKELNIIRHDSFLKKIEVVNKNGKTVEWVIDLYYRPLDILSGDSYSVREIEEGKVLIYLADAMGKGLSASVTSIVSTSFVNHLVDEAKEGSGFDFGKFIAEYSKFIRKKLIEEEILCVTLIFLDLITETMDTVICSMPPTLCHASDDTIVRIGNNNMPLMVYPAEMKIDRCDISGFHKILAHTDGLNESFRTEDSLYQQYLEGDFRQSEFGNHLSGRFNNAIKKPDDDITFIFVRRIEHKPRWTKVFTIAARMEELTAVTTEMEEVLGTPDTEAGFNGIFICAFNEMLMNAYEHGSLNIDPEQKGRMVRDDTYQDYLLEAEKESTKKIDISLSLDELNGQDYLMLTVADEGEGFDTSLLSKSNWDCDTISLHGRGVQLAQCLTDELFYNRAGNEATLLKRITRG